MALALYRKYRPSTFSEVVGQEHVTEPLRTALAAGRINHAYLFSGPRGCGKTSSARILARSLNCEQGPTPDPCGVCPSCIALAPEGPGSLDVVELDAASHGGVDDTRDLRDKAFYMPAESRYRVFIIDEAHMVSPQGFNALLKIVEEPPEHLVFIFATTEPDKVMTTIRSRTHHYPFRLIPPTTLRRLLERLCAEEDVLVEPTVFPLVIRAGGGSARDSLSILDQLLAGAGAEGVTYRSAVALLGVTDAALLDEVVDALAATDGASMFGAVDRVVEAGHDPRRFAADLLQRLRDLVIINAVPDAAAKGLIDAPEDQLTSMVGQADRLGIATLTRLAEVMHTGLVDMRGTTSPRLVLELLCARMLLPGASTGDAALLQRLERMERRMDIAGDVGAVEAAAATAHGAVTASRPAVPRSSAGEARDDSAAAAARSTAPPAGRGASAPDAGSGAADADRPDQSPAAATPVRPASAPRPVPAGPDLGLPVRPTLSSDRPAPARPDSAGSQPEPAAPTAPPGERSRSGGHSPNGSSAGSVSDPAISSAVAPPTASGRAPAGPATTTTGAGGSDSAGTTSASAASGPSLSDASVPVPPTAVSPTDSSAIGVTDVRRVWPEVMGAVKRQRRTTEVILDSATVLNVESGVLRIAMVSAVMARRATEPNNSDVLRAALREVLGVDWIVRFETAGAGSAPADGPPRGATGGPPSASPALRSGSDPVPPAPPPPDIDPPDEEIPDDYGEPLDPSAEAVVVRDPEEVAIALLSSELGARRLDPPA